MSSRSRAFAKTSLSAVAAIALMASTAAAQTEIKLGHVGAPGSLFAQSADIYAAKVNAQLGDKAKVVVYGSSQLGGDTELLKKLKLGTVDLALISTVMTSVAPEFGVFEMPYLVQNRDHAARIAKEVTHPSLDPLPKRPATAFLASGRTAIAKSPTASVRSSSRPTSKA